MITFPLDVSFKRRNLDYDPSKIGNHDYDCTFLQYMNTFTGVPFEADQNSHCHIVEKFLNNALCASYPKLGVAKKSEFITQTTFKATVERNAKLRM